MGAGTARGRRAAAVVAGLVVVGGLAWWWMPRDSATDVALDDVVDRFRNTTVPTTSPAASPDAPSTTIGATVTAPATTAPAATTTSPLPAGSTAPDSAPVVAALPEPGVYRYRTSGSESIDALGGAEHEYPAETTITVTDDGCGRLLRWDALEERREEWRLCPDDAHVVWQPTSLQYHEWYGQRTPQDVTCDVAVALTDPTSGPVQQECRLAEDPWRPRWEYVAADSRTVGGVDVPVHHVQMVVDDTDDLPESYVMDWFVRDDGLPVELVVDKRRVTPSPLGGEVEYLESYRLELIDLTPTR